MFFTYDSKLSLKIINEENKILKLISNNVKDANVTFRFFDEQGIKLLNDNIVVDYRFSKTYDLSNLPKGIYEVKGKDIYFLFLYSFVL